MIFSRRVAEPQSKFNSRILLAAGKAEPHDDDRLIRSAGLRHLDETSCRLDGRGAWIWYAGNADLDFFLSRST